MGEINVGGIVALVIFYLLILGIGLFAAWKRKRNAKNATTVIEETNEVILAGRSIGGIIGCFTMTGILVFYSMYIPMLIPQNISDTYFEQDR